MALDALNFLLLFAISIKYTKCFKTIGKIQTTSAIKTVKDCWYSFATKVLYQYWYTKYALLFLYYFLDIGSFQPISRDTNINKEKYDF